MTFNSYRAKIRKQFLNNDREKLHQEVLKIINNHPSVIKDKDKKRDLIFRAMIYLPQSSLKAFRSFYKFPFKIK